MGDLHVAANQVNTAAVTSDRSDPCPDDEALFSLAIGELPSSEREQMQEHVRECEACRDGLGEALLFLAPATDTSEQQAGEAKLPRLERYELQEVIGSGGAGVVYLAFDPTMRRQVAIKLLRPTNAAAPLIRRRLLREAHAMAKLSHPHVVTAYDVGESDAGVFIVLEYHSGGSLDSWLKSEHSAREHLKLLVQAGRGLGAAHEQGIVHRDFKPQNVLIGRHGSAYVTDFGLATFESQASENRFGLEGTVGEATMTRGVMGTPSYMAPEVIAGKAADQLADQFSYCVTAYLVLNGRHPFGVNSKTLVSDMLNRLQSEPCEPSNADVPPHIANALARGLSPDPSKRFASMSDLLAALEQSKPSARPQRSRRKAIALALIAMSLGAVAAAALWRDGAGSSSLPDQAAAETSPAQKEASAQSLEKDARRPASEIPSKPEAKQDAPVVRAKAKLPKTVDPAPTSAKKPTPKPTTTSKPEENPKSPPKKAGHAEERYDDWLRDPFR